MILELDLGNTRGKWRMLGAAGLERGSGAVADWIRGELPSSWSGVTRVRAASVLADDIGDSLAATILQRHGVTVEFARATAECAGVRSGYHDPACLGVDRWLGVVAAYREFRCPLVVVSAGTALTLDPVDADGLHGGGYIIPGSRLMAEALLRSTDRVRFAAAPLASTAPGHTTGDCVHNGIALALAGAVTLALTQMRATTGTVELVIAGGDASALAALLPNMVPHMRPDLVLDGLRLALP